MVLASPCFQWNIRCSLSFSILKTHESCGCFFVFRALTQCSCLFVRVQASQVDHVVVSCSLPMRCIMADVEVRDKVEVLDPLVVRCSINCHRSHIEVYVSISLCTC